MRTSLRALIGVVLSVLVWAAPARANVAALHDGCLNPTAEGWTSSPPNLLVLSGPRCVDNAWGINDTSTAFGTVFSYTDTLTAAQAADMASCGWRLTVRVRVQSGTATGAHTILGGSQVVAVRTPAGWFDVWFGQVGANLQLRVPTAFGADGVPTAANTYVISGAIGQFVDLEWFSCPGVGATLSVNGTVLLSGFAGVPFPPGGGAIRQVLFGAGSSFASGEAHWSLVRLETLPEFATQPQDICACCGLSSAAFFQATAVGCGPITFVWEESPANANAWVALTSGGTAPSSGASVTIGATPGGLTSMLTLAGITSDTDFRCRITGPGGCTTTSARAKYRCGIQVDINMDGNLDQDDVSAIINIIAGGGSAGCLP